MLSRPRQHTNTRFLNNVVRGVQSHNKAVLRASSSQLQANGEDSRQTPRRKRYYDHSNDSETGRSNRMRGWSDEGMDEVANGKGDVLNAKMRSGDRMGSDRERRIEKKKKKRHSERSDGQRRGDITDGYRRSTSSRHDRDATDSTRKREKQRSESETDNSTPPSKMDRYFSKGYDPMLDVDAKVRQGASGLIEDDGWDRMLSALKEKEERKRARKDAKVDGDRGKKSAPAVGTNLLDTSYRQRGTLREWDKGKDAMI